MTLQRDGTYEVEVMITPEGRFNEQAVDAHLADKLAAAGVEVQEIGEYVDDGEGTLTTTVLLTVARAKGVDEARLDEVIADAYADVGCPVDDVGVYTLLPEG